MDSRHHKQQRILKNRFHLIPEVKLTQMHSVRWALRFFTLGNMLNMPLWVRTRHYFIIYHLILCRISIWYKLKKNKRQLPWPFTRFFAKPDVERRNGTGSDIILHLPVPLEIIHTRIQERGYTRAIKEEKDLWA